MTARKISQFLDAINRHVGHTVRWITVLLMLVQFIVVLLRYSFGFTNIAINESVLYLHASLFMLAAGFTLLVDGHVRVDIFYANVSPQKQRLIDLFGHLFLLIPSMLVVLIYSWPSVRNSWRILEGPISVGGIPASFLLKTLIPLFCVLLILQSMSFVFKYFIGDENDGITGSE